MKVLLYIHYRLSWYTIPALSFQSVIKMPTKADMKNIQPNSDKTKDVVLEEVS